ncbi:hypothetical protein EOD43_17630 [Sphingomonas crocodyli]|uniref:Uncharacterized protein n=1 Tax=Sphingomonas crocodyli TaxID=1979270 RepID=A0A437LXJ5_9SPHN|nr:hypothetical protein EOD43_17630 [Sphingomonas crocodyli]
MSLGHHFPAGPFVGCILAVIITRCIIVLNTEGRRQVFLDIFVSALSVLLTAIWVQSHDLDLLAAGAPGVSIASLGIGVISIAKSAFAGRFKAAVDAFISGAPSP